MRREQILTVGSCFEACRGAEQGQGVAFGLFPLMTHWVEAGRLVVPFEQRTALSGLFFLRRRLDARPALTDLYAWLQAQVAGLRPLPPGRTGSPSHGA